MNLNLPLPPEGGRYSGCPHHQNHDTLTINRTLLGQPIIKDVPYVAERFHRDLTLEIWDYRKYGEHGYEGAGFPYEYCTGQDVVSYSIFEQGIWEGYESVLWMDVLHRGARDKIVLDLGCQLGWYSVLASTAGYEVWSVDSDREALNLTFGNVIANGQEREGTAVLGWFDETVTPIAASPIAAVKIDLEGAEQYALRMLDDSFVEGLIDYALVELSPVFNDSYEFVVGTLQTRGYHLFEIPQKGWERTEEYAEQPLLTLIETEPFTVESLEGISQTNVVAVSPGAFTLLT